MTNEIVERGSDALGRIDSFIYDNDEYFFGKRGMDSVVEATESQNDVERQIAVFALKRAVKDSMDVMENIGMHAENDERLACMAYSPWDDGAAIIAYALDNDFFAPIDDEDVPCIFRMDSVAEVAASVLASINMVRIRHSK